MKKKILMVVKNTFELDNRVFRAADALAGQGHEVLLLAYHRAGLKRCETLGTGFRLRRIQLYGRDYGKRGRVYNMLKFGVFLKNDKSIVDRFKPDIVHCHDYNTLDVGLYARRKHGAGLVYDCHEYFQDLGYLKRYPMILRVLVAAYERWAVRRVDRMIVVSPGIARAYEKLSPRQLTVVRNIPSLPRPDAGPTRCQVGWPKR